MSADLPPGYPQEYLRLVTLRDGRSVLIRMLAQAASERGIHTFTGAYLADNRPVAALINAVDDPANRVTSRGIAEFSVALPPPDRGSSGTIRGTGE